MKTLFLLLSASIAACSSAPTPVTGVAGDWRVSIATSDGKIDGFASLTQNGDQISGWVGPDPRDPIPITGILSGKTLTIVTHPQPGRVAAFDECVLTVLGERMSGEVRRGRVRGATVEFRRAAP
jgi:hypothetical protein